MIYERIEDVKWKHEHNHPEWYLAEDGTPVVVGGRTFGCPACNGWKGEPHAPHCLTPEYKHVPEQVTGNAADIEEHEAPRPINADDVRATKFYRDALGRVFPEVKLGLAVQVLRAVGREHVVSNEARALCAAALEVIEHG